MKKTHSTIAREMRLPVADSTRLQKLKRSIKSERDSIMEFSAKARVHAQHAIASAIVTGQRIAEAKSILGGDNWKYWVTQGGHKINEREARCFLAIHNQFAGRNDTVSDLPATSLRKASIALGIFDDESTT